MKKREVDLYIRCIMAWHMQFPAAGREKDEEEEGRRKYIYKRGREIIAKGRREGEK